MSYEFYKILHFAGMFAVFIALSSMIAGAQMAKGKDFANRKLLSAVHGVGMLVTLVAGFGLLAKLGLFTQFPTWAIGKLVVWFILGGYSMAIYRNPQKSKMWWTGLWILGVIAAYLARTKIG